MCRGVRIHASRGGSVARTEGGTKEAGVLTKALAGCPGFRQTTSSPLCYRPPFHFYLPLSTPWEQCCNTITREFYVLSYRFRNRTKVFPPLLFRSTSNLSYERISSIFLFPSIDPLAFLVINQYQRPEICATWLNNNLNVNWKFRDKFQIIIWGKRMVINWRKISFERIYLRSIII